jgi:hypothetical protein
MGAEDSAREWRKGDSEEWPTEHTEYTERGAGSGGVAGGSREGGGVFYHERRDGRRAGPETLPANCAKGRERGSGDSEEWPTEHTEYTERGRRGGNRRNGKGDEDGMFAHGTHGKGEGGGRDPETEAGENSGAGGRRT